MKKPKPRKPGKKRQAHPAQSHPVKNNNKESRPRRAYVASGGASLALAMAAAFGGAKRLSD